MKRILSLAVIIVMMVSLLGVFSVSAQEDSEVMRVNASLNKDLCGCGFINVPLSTGAKVSSVEALGDHICNYNLINLQHNFDRNKYDKSFFEEKFLFFFTMYESKSGNKYELTSLTELKDAVIVEITKVKQGNLTVEEFWLLALEIDRELAG
ncbi:MAG: hypothetical protein FWF85_07875, partial [Clostridiales bacterium]|nr:hypothetical protein [Clostridiales bacterium]